MPTTKPTTLISCKDLVKSYGSVQALRGLSFELKSGECLGLLGPNGAGKSTLMGSLYGQLVYSSGELQVLGMSPQKQATQIKERIGVLPQENCLDEGLSVFENMSIYARFLGLNKNNSFERIDQLLDYMSLKHKRNATIASLSGGMKRRLAFLRALLHDPELLVLDEPTTGLDPSIRHLLWQRVRELRDQGKGILVSTHYIHEAEALCDRVIIMAAGKVIAEGSPTELLEAHARTHPELKHSSLEQLYLHLTQSEDQGGELQ